MPLLTKVGSFAKIDTTGSQAITGLGFTPKCLVLWSTGSNSASGTWDAHITSTLGFTAGATNSFAVATCSVDGVGTSDTARRMAATVITLINGAGTVNSEAGLASFDADGFTLNWTTNSTADPAFTSMNINFLALGGSDLTGAKVVNWTTPTAVGNKAVTGAGFSPDLVLHASSLMTSIPQSAGEAQMVFGAMNKHGQQWANAASAADAVSPSNTSRYQQTDACVAMVGPGEVLLGQAHFVSMDADGFTTHHANVNANAFNMMSLCLKGVSSKVGAFAKTTAAAPAAQSVTRVGFQPKAVLFSDYARIAGGAPVAQAIWSLGAYDGAAQRNATLFDNDNVNPTQADSVFYADKVLAHVTGVEPVVAGAIGAATSMDTDGFSLSWSPNDAAARESLYLALGDAGVNTFPTRVG